MFYHIFLRIFRPSLSADNPEEFELLNVRIVHCGAASISLYYRTKCVTINLVQFTLEAHLHYILTDKILGSPVQSNWWGALPSMVELCNSVCPQDNLTIYNSPAKSSLNSYSMGIFFFLGTPLFAKMQESMSWI